MRDTVQQQGVTYCLRHPDTETGLRCGRCGDPICPRCMIQSPVGGRCPTCARIGASPMFQVTASSFALALTAGLGAALVAGAVFVGVLFVAGLFPYGYWLGLVGGQLAVGYVVGEAVRRASGYRVDRRLQYLAGTSAFLAFVVSIIVLLAVPRMHPLDLANILGFVGLAISVYVAMGRVRP